MAFFLPDFLGQLAKTNTRFHCNYLCLKGLAFKQSDSVEK
jgi:hypothetical protein